MRRSMLLGTAAVLIATLTPSPGQAQQMRRPPVVGSSGAEVIDAELSLSRSIELAPVSMAEILSSAVGGSQRVAGGAGLGGASMSLGTWSPGAGSAVARTVGQTMVRRSVPDVWQFRQSAEQRRTQHLDIGYSIHSLESVAGHLSHPADPSSQVRVRLEAITPFPVGTDGEYDVLQGGVDFYLDLSGVRRAGSHLGSLTVTFNNF